MGRMVNHYFHLPQRHPQQVFFGARFLSQQEIIFLWHKGTKKKQQLQKVKKKN